MNEARWLAATDARPMLDYLRTNRIGSERKYRLYAAARCRQKWELLDHAARQLVAAAERFADERATAEELAATQAEVKARSIEGTELKGIAVTWAVPASARPAIGRLPLLVPTLFREIFGNPFRAVALDPAWLAWNGGCAEELARVIYEERSFERLPVLADALEEAGCGDAELLGHLRGPGPHYRGCWALDLVLGKQ